MIDAAILDKFVHETHGGLLTLSTTLLDMQERLVDATGGEDFTCGTPRSSAWAGVRDAHLARQPECQACGTVKGCEVHHAVPYHVAPSQELETSNLITLCRTRGCHWIFGHLFDWRSWNPCVFQDVMTIRGRINAARRHANAQDAEVISGAPGRGLVSITQGIQRAGESP